MLNEWLELEDYKIDKYYDGFGLAIDTTDWLFIAMLGGYHDEDSLLAEMREDWSWETERDPFYVHVTITEDDHDVEVIAHNWCGAKHWELLIRPAEFGPEEPSVSLKECPF